MPVDNMQDPNVDSQNMAQPSPEMPMEGGESPTSHGDSPMTDDDIAATLGYITTLSQKMMAPQGTEETTTEEGGGESPTSHGDSPVSEEKPQEEPVKTEEVKNGEVLKEIKTEMADIKGQLEQLLQEEDTKENGTNKETKD